MLFDKSRPLCRQAFPTSILLDCGASKAQSPHRETSSHGRHPTLTDKTGFLQRGNIFWVLLFFFNFLSGFIRHGEVIARCESKSRREWSQKWKATGWIFTHARTEVWGTRCPHSPWCWRQCACSQPDRHVITHQHERNHFVFLGLNRVSTSAR